jgi:hypothetical protein
MDLCTTLTPQKHENFHRYQINPSKSGEEKYKAQIEMRSHWPKELQKLELTVLPGISQLSVSSSPDSILELHYSQLYQDENYYTLWFHVSMCDGYALD